MEDTLTEEDPPPIRLELDLDWEAEYVPPGTMSDEDPPGEIPSGWWVFGYNPAGTREAEMFVRGIYDVHGDDVSEQVARLLCERLNETSQEATP
jgi:hypothetical protein